MTQEAHVRIKLDARDVKANVRNLAEDSKRAATELQKTQKAAAGAAGQLKKVERHTRLTSKASNVATQGINRLGRALAHIAAFATVGFGLAKVTTDLQELDTNLKRLGTVGGDVPKADKALGQLSQRLGGVANKAELAAAAYQAMSAGFDSTSEAIQVVEASAKASVGGLAEMSEVVKIVAGALNAYNLQASQAIQITDTISKTIEDGRIEWSNYTAQMGRVIGTAAFLGISFNELNAFIGAATKNSATAEIAFTGLSSALNTLLNPSGKVLEAAKTLDINWSAAGIQAEGFGNLLVELAKKSETNKEAAAQLVGSQRAMRGVFLAAKNAGADYTEILETLGDAAGKTDDDFEQLEGSLSNKLKALDTSFRNLSENIGRLFSLEVKQDLEEGTGLINALATAVGQLPRFTAVATTEVGKFAAALVALKVVLEGIFKLNVVTLLTGVTAKTVHFQRVINGKTGIVKKNISAMGGFIAKLKVTTKTATGLIGKVKALSGVLGALALKFGLIIITIKLVFDGLGHLARLEQRLSAIRGQSGAQFVSDAGGEAQSREEIRPRLAARHARLANLKEQLKATDPGQLVFRDKPPGIPGIPGFLEPAVNLPFQLFRGAIPELGRMLQTFGEAYDTDHTPPVGKGLHRLGRLPFRAAKGLGRLLTNVGVPDAIVGEGDDENRARLKALIAQEEDRIAEYVALYERTPYNTIADRIAADRKRNRPVPIPDKPIEPDYDLARLLIDAKYARLIRDQNTAIFQRSLYEIGGPAAEYGKDFRPALEFTWEKDEKTGEILGPAVQGYRTHILRFERDRDLEKLRVGDLSPQEEEARATIRLAKYSADLNDLITEAYKASQKKEEEAIESAATIQGIWQELSDRLDLAQAELKGGEKGRLEKKIEILTRDTTKDILDADPTADVSNVEAIVRNLLTAENAVDNLKDKTDAWKDALESIATTLSDTLVSAFDAAVEGTENFGEALKALGAELLKTIAKILIMHAISEALGALGSDGEGEPKGVLTFLSEALKPRAEGGPVEKGIPYLVGERGPELFVPYQSGQIASSEHTSNMYQGGGSSNTSNMYQGGGSSNTSNMYQGGGKVILPFTKGSGDMTVMALEQQSQEAVPIRVMYQSQVINNVEYVTAEQHRRGMAQAAEQGRALTIDALQNSVKVRKKVAI